MLDEKDRLRVLGPYKKVLQWMEDTKNATNPHFNEVHKLLFKVKEKLQNQRLQGANNGTESGMKNQPHSRI